MKKIDPHSGETFVQKRRNQIFATAKNRIDYNNLQAAKLRDKKSNILKPMDANYSILCDLLKPNELKHLTNEFLVGKGFTHNLFTHVDTYKSRQCYGFFDFVFIPNEVPNTLTIYRKK